MIRARLVLSTLLIGSVALATACDGGGDLGGDTPDGGGQHQPDGGSQTDGGGQTVDNRTPRQTPQLDGTVGGHCELGEQSAQGSCDDGLTCFINDEHENVCTALCQQNADCGSNGAEPNYCIAIGSQSACFRGCDPWTAGSCNRVNWTCWPFASTPVCLPDCRVQGNEECGEGLGCDRHGGFCRPVGTRSHYETCDDQNRCDIDGICLLSSGGQDSGVCTMDCTGRPTECPSGSYCMLSVGNGIDICVQPCSATKPECPTATTCTDVGGGQSYCLP